jgi:hypothetical protein
MFNKENIVKSIDAFIKNAGYKLTEEEIEFLTNIKNQIAFENQEEQILAWAFELLKFIIMFNDIFHK